MDTTFALHSFTELYKVYRGILVGSSQFNHGDKEGGYLRRASAIDITMDSLIVYI